MKKLTVLAGLFFISSCIFSQNVGIGSAIPVARLHVADSNVLFTGPNPFVNYNPPQLPPVQGAGTRVMWYSQKAAFRAGWVEDNRWDKDSIGIFSMAFGHSTLASYTGSTAFGIRSSARGTASTAFGWGSSANADYSIAAGYFNRADGPNSMALGTESFSSGIFSTSIGIHAVSLGNSSIAIGDSSIASGTQSISAGANISAKARASFVTGWYNDISDNPDPTSISPTDRIFQIGNGNGFTLTRSNALTILRNGNTGIGTVNPLARLHVADSNVLFTGPATIFSSTPFSPAVQGAGTRMMWYPQKAAFRAGTVYGTEWDKDNIGLYSFAAGLSVTASGLSSTAIGNGATASGSYSTAIGNSLSALGNNSTAMGVNTLASGNISTAMGFGTRAKAFASTTIGQFNDESDNPDPNTPAASDRIFQIGNAIFPSRTNALTILRNGNIGVGTLNPGQKLSVKGAEQEIASFDGGDGMFITFSENGNYVGYIGSYAQSNTLGDVDFGTHAGNPNGSLHLITQMTPRISITPNGNVGIGVTNPSKKTEIIGPASGTPVTLVIGNRGAFGPAAMEFVSDYGLVNQWRPGYVKSNDVGGFTGALEFYTNGAGSGSLYGNVKGFEVRNGVAYTATGTVSSFSDVRVKKNIQSFNHGLDVITKINPVSFNYNNLSPFNTDKKQIGIIAQELEKIAPYMVDRTATKEMNDLRSVDNQAYVFLLINAVKELAAQNEKQQKEIEKLKRMIKQ
jgi:hypothetical protein